MDLFVVGLNHQTAPIEIRERLATPDSVLSRALEELRQTKLAESAILSTCNRTEVYGVPTPESGPESAIQFLSDRHSIPRNEFESHLYLHQAESAAIHLHRVACGLDSLVLGEPQILGQVKDSFAAGAESGSVGRILNSLFRSCIASGKRARTETGIGRGGFSIGNAALDLAHSVFGTLESATVLVLGAGKMSELTARHFLSAGVQLVLVANRTFERAESIARKFGGRAINYDALPDSLLTADVIICSTASPTPIIKHETILAAQRRRRGKPIFIIDIALPRDVESEVGHLENVFLYNLDDLQEVVMGTANERAKEAPLAEAIAREESARFAAWYHGLQAVPLLLQLKEKHEEIRVAEIQRLRNQIPELSEEVWNRIEAATSSMINRITRDPINVLKAAAAGADDSPEVDLLAAAQTLFALPNGASPITPVVHGGSEGQAATEGEEASP